MTYCETSILHFRVNIIWNFTLVKDLNVRWWMPYFKKRGLWMSTQSSNEIHFLLFIWRRKSKCAAILKLVMHCWHSFVIFSYGRPPICTADNCEAATDFANQMIQDQMLLSWKRKETVIFKDWNWNVRKTFNLLTYIAMHHCTGLYSVESTHCKGCHTATTQCSGENKCNQCGYRF